MTSHSTPSRNKAGASKYHKNTMLMCSLCIIFLILFVVFLVLYLFEKGKKPFTNNTNLNPFDNYNFDNDKSNAKYKDLIKHIGTPTYIELSANNDLNSVTWMAPLDNYEPGYAGGRSNQNKQDGLDYIRLNAFVGRKHHPIAADMQLIVGKYIQVPQELLGPLKHASHTINIEQLVVPKHLNNNFGKTQEHNEKGKSLVTGSCASVTISAITVGFVENMIAEYNEGKLDLGVPNIEKVFIDRYDTIILDYLCKNKAPHPTWFNAKDFGEPVSMDAISQCSDQFSSNGNHNKKGS